MVPERLAPPAPEQSEVDALRAELHRLQNQIAVATRCSVCFEARPRRVTRPCDHEWACQECHERVQVCGICREPWTEHVQAPFRA